MEQKVVRQSLHMRTRRGVSAMIFEAPSIEAMKQNAQKWQNAMPHRADFTPVIVTVTEESTQL